MAKFKLKVDKKTGQNYLPKDIREEGFTGVVDGLANAVTVTLIKPGSKWAAVETSLGITLKDVQLRRQVEEGMMKDVNENLPAKSRVKHQQDADPQHALFHKYTRDWLSEATGYSKGYLSRVATGNIPLTRSFVERVCFKLGRLEEELFLPDTVADSDQKKSITW